MRLSGNKKRSEETVKKLETQDTCTRLHVLAELTDKDFLGWSKCLSIVSCAQKIYYHIGVWDTEGNLKKKGILFTELELKKLTKELTQLSKQDPDLELEKFQRDYIQQSHNGEVSKEKEDSLQK